jgi:MoxR-like ATPase
VQPAVVIDALTHTIVGQSEVVESLVLALIADGHVLLEGPPGLAKTLACRCLAAALEGQFKRVQFTPDLLPADIVGTRVFDPTGVSALRAPRPPSAEPPGPPAFGPPADLEKPRDYFTTVLGPIFANVVLADEINRAPAKVQSALLEAMQERQVTIGPETHKLPDPFIVLATMNPIDADGTYALPFAQLDRFLLKVRVDLPSHKEERAILDRFAVAQTQPVHGVASLDDVLAWRRQAHAVHLEEKIKHYIVELVMETRKPSPYVEHGASPRATLALAFVARAKALLAGRDFVFPDDVRLVAPLVLRHRIGFTHRVAVERIDREELLLKMIGAVPAP